MVRPEAAHPVEVRARVDTAEAATQAGPMPASNAETQTPDWVVPRLGYSRGVGVQTANPQDSDGAPRSSSQVRALRLVRVGRLRSNVQPLSLDIDNGVKNPTAGAAAEAADAGAVLAAMGAPASPAVWPRGPMPRCPAGHGLQWRGGSSESPGPCGSCGLAVASAAGFHFCTICLQDRGDQRLLCGDCCAKLRNEGGEEPPRPRGVGALGKSRSTGSIAALAGAPRPRSGLRSRAADWSLVSSAGALPELPAALRPLHCARGARIASTRADASPTSCRSAAPGSATLAP